MLKTLRVLIVVAFIAVIPLSFEASPVHAAATAQGVELNEYADCSSNADLDITFTAGTITRELGWITNETKTLGYFEQSSSFSGFSGTFVGYGQPINTPQPEGTLIGSYAYVGDTPPDTDTAEFFIAYECSDTPGENVVVYTCYGEYGKCPQTIQEYKKVDFPYLGLVQLNVGAPVTPYAGPGAYPVNFTLPADADGNGFDTYVVTAVTTVNGQYWVALWIGGKDYLWLPYTSVIPLTAIVGIP